MIAPPPAVRKVLKAVKVTEVGLRFPHACRSCLKTRRQRITQGGRSPTAKKDRPKRQAKASGLCGGVDLTGIEVELMKAAGMTQWRALWRIFSSKTPPQSSRQFLADA